MNTLFFMLRLSSSNTLLITSPFQRHLSISAIIQKKYILFISFAAIPDSGSPGKCLLIQARQLLAWLITQKKTGSPLRDSRPGKGSYLFLLKFLNMPVSSCSDRKITPSEHLPRLSDIQFCHSTLPLCCHGLQ